MLIINKQSFEGDCDYGPYDTYVKVAYDNFSNKRWW